MAARKKYPDELRERAVRMVLEIREREGKGVPGRYEGISISAPVRAECCWRARRQQR